MSPRYEEDTPRPRGRKEFPLGMVLGCGVFALVIIGAAIWVLINLISTVGDAAKPNDNTDTNGVQTSVIAPGEDGSTAIPNNNGDIDEQTSVIAPGEDGSTAIPNNNGDIDDDPIAAEPGGSNTNSSVDIDDDAESNSTEENQTEENEDNVVYVTETVVAQ